MLVSFELLIFPAFRLCSIRPRSLPFLSTTYYLRPPPSEWWFRPDYQPILPPHGNGDCPDVLGSTSNRNQHVVHMPQWSPPMDRLGRRPLQLLSRCPLPYPPHPPLCPQVDLLPLVDHPHFLRCFLRLLFLWTRRCQGVCRVLQMGPLQHSQAEARRRRFQGYQSTFMVCISTSCFNLSTLTRDSLLRPPTPVKVPKFTPYSPSHSKHKDDQSIYDASSIDKMSFVMTPTSEASFAHTEITDVTNSSTPPAYVLPHTANMA
jgi:hypothetical protein